MFWPIFAIKLGGKPITSEHVGTLDGKKIANCQLLAFSKGDQLSQTIPQVHVERMLNE